MNRWTRLIVFSVIMVVVGILMVVHSQSTTQGRSTTLLVSGNIEAHESLLSFETVQSRLVELAFDEGQWVDEQTVLAHVDDEEYRQRVSVAAAT